MQLGRVGLWTFQLDLQPAPQAREAAAELESLGYPAVWVPEAVGRDPMVNAAMLLGATDRLVLATGIASIWSRDAMAAAASHLALSEAWPDRFLLGLGVSHQPMVDFVKGHHYDKPLTKMSGYLDAMDAAVYVAPRPARAMRVLAALGPKMLALAAEKANGAHPYFVPVEHTPIAREALGAVLESRGASVQTVRSGHAALEQLARLPTEAWPQVLICDIALGEESGYDVLRQLRALEGARDVALERRLPAVALTGYAGADDRMQALLAGFQIHLAKPVDPDELAATVGTLARRRPGASVH